MSARQRAVAFAVLAGVGGTAHAEKEFKMPDSDTTVTLGGYVKADAIWSSRSAAADNPANPGITLGDQQLSPTTIPIGPNAGQHKSDQVTLHARQTRLSLGTSTPTDYGKFSTFIEGDFFGESPNANESATNSTNFRIRHAYGTLGNFSAGQYWTNFFNEQAYAETLDFGGPQGEIFIRQGQLRWTQKLASGDWSVSVENPESVFAVPGTGATFRSGSDHAPDLTGRVKLRIGRGTYSLGVLARNIHIDSAAAGVPAAPVSANKWGGALALTGITSIGRDDLRFNVNAGNAIGRYQVGGIFPDGYLDTTGQVRLATQESGYIAYRHFWSPKWRSNVEVSAANSNPPAGTFSCTNNQNPAAACITKSDRSQHLNLIWSPVPYVNLGGELIHASRTVVGGDHGALNRVQFSAQYNF